MTVICEFVSTVSRANKINETRHVTELHSRLGDKSLDRRLTRICRIKNVYSDYKFLARPTQHLLYPNIIMQCFVQIMLALLVSVIVLCSTGTVAAPESCQGLNNLCNVKVSDAYFAMVHNAMSSVDNGFLVAANHMEDPIVESLDAGYRALSIDICNCNGELQLCHGSESIGCGIGRLDPLQAFTEINDWVETNPNNVIMLSLQVNEEAGGDISLEMIKALLQAAGIYDRLYDHRPVDGSKEWPTFGELIEANKQVLYFYFHGPEGIGDHVDGLNYMYDFTQCTGFEWESVEDLETNLLTSCTVTRGKSSTGDFFMIEAFVTEAGIFGLEYQPSRDASQVINTAEWAGNTLDACLAIQGTTPNIFSVDFWTEGDLPTLMHQRNALLVEDTPPSTPLPTMSPVPDLDTRVPTTKPTIMPPATALPSSIPSTPPIATAFPTVSPSSFEGTGTPTTTFVDGPTDLPTSPPTSSPTNISDIGAEDVCTLELDNGEKVVFSNGESYGDYLSTQCGTAADFPCYCNPSLPGKIECPYCGIPSLVDSILHCARHNETIEFVDGMVVKTCYCEIPSNPFDDPITNCQEEDLPSNSNAPSTSPSDKSSQQPTTMPSTPEVPTISPVRQSTNGVEDPQSSSIDQKIFLSLVMTLFLAFYE